MLAALRGCCRQQPLDGCWSPLEWRSHAPTRPLSRAQVRHLIHAINEATSKIPGWDEYEKTGVAKELWDGVV